MQCIKNTNEYTNVKKNANVKANKMQIQRQMQIQFEIGTRQVPILVPAAAADPVHLINNVKCIMCKI